VSFRQTTERLVDRIEDFQAVQRLNDSRFPPLMPLDVVRGVSMMPNSKIGPTVGSKSS
jgi:hypothetical protein